MDLTCKNISYSIKDKQILKNVSLNVSGNKFFTILGPNGCGKTTLLKTIYRVLKPASGEILLNNKNIESIRLKDSAKEMAVVAQFNKINFDCNVEDIVMLGRSPHINFLQSEKQNDFDIVKDALRDVGMLDKANRSYSSLSGGEKQRTLLARALSQKAPLIILDEPTNHLDIGYQYQIMNILKRQKLTMLCCVHDLNIAATYCDRIILMKKREVFKIGTPREMLISENIKELFHIDTQIVENEKTGSINIIFLPEL